MLKSKSLKEPEDRKESKLYLWWIETPMSDWWHDFIWFFQKPYLRAKKLYEWDKNVFVHDYDFDAHGLYRIIEYKLKRIYPVLEEGHSIQENRDMQALRIAIKLAGRLDEDHYDNVQLDRHDKVWGKLHTTKTPCEFDKNGETTMYSMQFFRDNANTPELEEQEANDRMAGYARASKQKLRDQRNLYSILTKYTAVWWD